MGEAYRARDTRLGRTVAIKILPAQFSSDAARRQRFEREAKTISQLNHPHICVLHDVGRQDGIDYLVMECVEGETLATRIFAFIRPWITIQCSTKSDSRRNSERPAKAVSTASDALRPTPKSKFKNPGVAKLDPSAAGEPPCLTWRKARRYTFRLARDPNLAARGESFDGVGSPVAAFETSPPSARAISASKRLVKTDFGCSRVISIFEA
jgi:hypothetical protein